MRLDRAVFVIGEPGWGKSTQIWSVLNEPPLSGVYGGVPEDKRGCQRVFEYDHHRMLALKVSSPHEYEQNMPDLFNAIDKLMASSSRPIGVWSLICALQPYARYEVPDSWEVIAKMRDRYQCATSALVINPGWKGRSHDAGKLSHLVHEIAQTGTDVCVGDGSGQVYNGRLILRLAI